MEERTRAEQIHRLLAVMENRITNGNRIGDACRQLGLNRATYYRWRHRYGEMTPQQIGRHMELKQEKGNLQRQVNSGDKQLGIATSALSQIDLEPHDRRNLVVCTQVVCRASERMACQTLGQARSTQRYRGKDSSPCRRLSRQELSNQVISTAAQYPRYGYRRIAQKLQERGVRVSRSQVYAIWQRERLAVPLPQRIKRRQAINWQTHRRQAKHPNHIWTWDFVRTCDLGGHRLLFLSLLDEFTRECLCLEVRRDATAQWLIDVLRSVLEQRGGPRYLRSDNEDIWTDPEVRNFLSDASIIPLSIPPGAPWHNAYIESFQSRLWDELLDTDQFANLHEAQASASQWKLGYNRYRTHSSLGNQTPEVFAAKWQQDGSHNKAITRRPTDGF